ncbi:MAG: hypothetical protein Q8L48_23065 [Archangium sp.]|nr:hypothetical protein [Archangium sp.]
MTELSKGRIATAIALGVLPLALWTVLNFMRPDLMAPMLSHVFGYVLSGVELLLTSLGVLVFLVAGLQTGAGTRIGLQIGGFLLCTLPALFLVLFGPIVFAFMYGNVS